MNPIIAFDESGNTGENLLDPAQPVFTLASVYFEDDEARALTAILSSSQDAEIHFVNLKRRPSGRQKVLEFLSSDLISPTKVKLSVINKSFMVTTKVVDLLIENMAFCFGVDLYKQGMNIATSNLHHSVIPTFCGIGKFEEFQRRFVQMIRNKDEKSVQNFYDFIIELQEVSADDGYKDDLRSLYATRYIVSEILLGIHEYELDPAIPSVVQHCYAWGDYFQREFDLVHDVSKPIKNFEEVLLCMMAKDEPEIKAGYDYRKAVLPLKATGVTFCDSKQVPQLQIADIFASACAYLANGFAGVSVDKEFWEKLRTSVINKLIIGMVWPSTAVTPEELGTIETGGINIANYTGELIARQMVKRRKTE